LRKSQKRRVQRLRNHEAGRDPEETSVAPKGQA
jgi:hypothetical protein